MQFIGCQLTERKGGQALKAKISTNENDLLLDFVKSAIRRFCKKDAGTKSLQVEDEEAKRPYTVSHQCLVMDMT